MTWDHRYRMLAKDEIIIWTDEVQKDDGSWRPAIGGVGKPSPDPLYTSHRVYRRLKAS